MDSIQAKRTGAAGCVRHSRGVSAMPCLGLLSAGLLLWSFADPSPAAACGGLFCNNNQPVNQTAERIIFVDNGDDTTTAVIEIQYQGPSERFAWVLPVPDIANPDDDIRVSSTIALDRLQQATNPQYNLRLRFEDGCAVPTAMPAAGTPGAGAMLAPETAAADTAVTVEASGSVGPFDWTLLGVDLEKGDDPVQEAVDWLEDNDYDVTAIGPDLLRPYLEAGNKLLAVKLTKGNDTGAIRPLMITYAGDKPSIPIRPTAVAAEDDMAIMVFVGGGDRAIPRNYNLLELNEALIDWYQPMRNYNEVVTAAANEAGGHGFVTEYADLASNLQNIIVPQWERQQWDEFSGQSFASPLQMYNQAGGRFGSWDGFREAFTASLTIPEGADFDIDDILGCPNCYLNNDATQDDTLATLDMELFRRKLFEQVVRPMLETEALVQSQPWVTRFYTTMSAEEMTEDPSFDFNPDLEPVSNIHTAERIVACESGFNGPWRVEFEGGTVEGTEVGTWPLEVATTRMPAALRILTVGTSGPPTVMIDSVDESREAMEETMDEDMDESMERRGRSGDGDGDDDDASEPVAGNGGAVGDEDEGDDDEGDDDEGDDPKSRPDGSDDDDGGLFCSVSAPGRSHPGPSAAWAFGVLGFAWVRRARRLRGR
ncbi:MAG: DUF2330 domain-containing protein [Myxococcales bacterium]|nr:DUF2330 domain-containing protein [Myxococcales bacterium]